MGLLDNIQNQSGLTPVRFAHSRRNDATLNQTINLSCFGFVASLRRRVRQNFKIYFHHAKPHGFLELKFKDLTVISVDHENQRPMALWICSQKRCWDADKV